MLIGYARVSTQDQNVDLQKDELLKIGCEKVFEEKASGAKTDRPVLQQAIEYCREGDTLVVWKLDRFGRSLKDLIERVKELETKNIGLKVLQENIDTSSAGGKLIFHLFGALAEFERDIVRERTKAGLQSARARGRVGGRPPKLTDKEIEEMKEKWESKKYPVKDILKLYGIKKSRFYELVR